MKKFLFTFAPVYLSEKKKVGIIAPAVSTVKTKEYKLVERGSINILLPDGRKYGVKGVIR